MKKVAIYMRVATREQLDESGSSVKAGNQKGKLSPKKSINGCKQVGKK